MGMLAVPRDNRCSRTSWQRPLCIILALLRLGRWSFTLGRLVAGTESQSFLVFENLSFLRFEIATVLDYLFGLATSK
jgi:hypothetical protein